MQNRLTPPAPRRYGGLDAVWSIRQRQARHRLGLVFLFVFSLLSVVVPGAPLDIPVQVLDEETVVAPVSIPEQTYELYLDAPTSETGGQGSITTIEPNGGQEEGALSQDLNFAALR